MGICGWLSTTLFAISHWMFAYKYWIMSFRIETALQGDSTPDLKCQTKTNVITLVSIVFSSSLSTLLFYLISFVAQRTSTLEIILFYSALRSTAFFDGFSCYLLFDAFRRIRKHKVAANLKINTAMMHVHQAAYALFVVSLLFYFVSNVGGPSWFVAWMTILVCVTSFASQALLIFIFNRIAVPNS